MTEKNMPVAKKKAGKYGSAMFKNTVPGKNGKPDFDKHNLQLTKSWLKKDGDPEKTEDWNTQKMDIELDEIPKVQAMLEQMYQKFIVTDKE